MQKMKVKLPKLSQKGTQALTKSRKVGDNPPAQDVLTLLREDVSLRQNRLCQPSLVMDMTQGVKRAGTLSEHDNVARQYIEAAKDVQAKTAEMK